MIGGIEAPSETGLGGPGSRGAVGAGGKGVVADGGGGASGGGRSKSGLSAAAGAAGPGDGALSGKCSFSDVCSESIVGAAAEATGVGAPAYRSTRTCWSSRIDGRSASCGCGPRAWLATDAETVRARTASLRSVIAASVVLSGSEYGILNPCGCHASVSLLRSAPD